MESIKIAKDSELVTMLVFDDVDSIVGVDERVYGPFRPQDLVVLPKINAKILLKIIKPVLLKSKPLNIVKNINTNRIYL